MSQRRYRSQLFYRQPVAAYTPPDGTMYWSDPATWFGSVPLAGDAVQISAGLDITYDVTSSIPPSLESITIDGGILRYSGSVDTFMRKRNLTIRNNGQLLCGTDSTANTRHHRRTAIGEGKAGRVRGYSFIGNTPTGNNGQSNDAINGQAGYARGLLLSTGGKYKVNSFRPALTKAHLQGNHAAGSTSLQLDQGVYWYAGDTILVHPTNLYNDARRTERFTVAADTNGSSVVQITGSGLGYFRWGLLQYPTNNWDISLTQGPFTLSSAGGARATAAVPNVIDQRAKVINVTRRYSVEGDNDSTYATEGLGAHEMYMDLDIEVTLRGVQYLLCGQEGMRGRYPNHFHMNGYHFNTSLGYHDTYATNPVTGLSDGKFATGQAVMEDCVVLDSQNRGFNSHGCIGVLYKNCVTDNTKSYGFITENGSEQLNTWDSCHATRTIAPPLPTQAFEASQPAGWWLSNVNNRFINTMGPGWDNSGADSLIGVVLNLTHARDGYPGGCFGESSMLPIFPGYQAPLQWDGFLHHSVASLGRQAFNFLADEQGNPTGSGDDFSATTTGLPTTNQDLEVASHFNGDKFWFCNGGAYGNNKYHPLYGPEAGWTICDIPGKGFQGNTRFGEQQNMLAVQRSLNNSEGDFTDWLLTIGYHGSLIPQNCTVIGYGAKGLPAPSNNGDRFEGILVMNVMTTTEDLYLDPIVSYSVNMTNLCSDPNGGPLIHLTPHPSLQNVAPFNQWAGNTDLAPNSIYAPGAYDPPGGSGTTAYYDPYGTLFKKGANRWGLIDHPAVTYGCENLVNVNSRDGHYIGNTTTTSQMIGFRSFPDGDDFYIRDENGNDISRHKFGIQRVNPSTLEDVSGASYTINNAPGREGGNHMFAAIPNGGALRIFDADTASGFISAIQKMGMLSTVLSNSSFLILGIKFPNSSNFNLYCNNKAGTFVTTPDAGSQSAFLAANDLCFWRNTATQMVWVRIYYANGYYNGNSTNPSGTYYRTSGFGTLPFYLS